MRVVLQRVTTASITIENNVVAKIDNGLLILLGITTEDTYEDISWLVKKLVNLRIFNDTQKKMNLFCKRL